MFFIAHVPAKYNKICLNLSFFVVSDSTEIMVDLFPEYDDYAELDSGVGNASVENGTNIIMNMKAALNCHTCYDRCVYKATESCMIAGIIANITVLIIIIKDRKLHTPTYVAIACLALSDATFLASNVIGAIEVVVRSLMCAFPLSYTGPLLASIKGLCWFSANTHICVIACVRYILLLYPLKGHIYLTNRRVLVSSACIWILGITIWMAVYALVKRGRMNTSESLIFVNVVWSIVYLTPLIVTFILHCQKLRHVRRSLQINIAGSGNIQRATVRMSRIILLIIILATCLPLPKFVFEILKREKVAWPSKAFALHFENIAIMLFLINSCINPVVYAFMSAPLQKSLKLLCFKEQQLHSVTTHVTYRYPPRVYLIHRCSASAFTTILI